MSTLTRRLEFDSRSADRASRTVHATVATTAPVEREHFTEVLDHSPEAIDLSRAPLPVIESHDLGHVPVAVAENLRIEGDRLRADIRFGSSARAQELFQDVTDRVIRHLSIGYRVLEWHREPDGIRRAVRWQPHEVSLVSVPADPGAQFFRSQTMTTDVSTDDDSTLTRSQRIAAARAAKAREEEDLLNRDAMGRERQRVAKILERLGAHRDNPSEASRKLVQLADAAIRDGTDAHEFAIRAFDIEQRAAQGTVAAIAKPATRRPHSGWIDAQGNEVRVYKPNERLADDFATRDAEGFRSAGASHEPLGDLGIGTFMRALAVGPRTDLEKRALGGATPTAGGHLVPTPLAPGLIDRLRAASVVVQAGAQTVPMDSQTLRIARLTTDPTASWLAEAAPMTPTVPAFDAVTLSAKTLRCLVLVSRELLADAPNIDQQLGAILTSALALELDRAALIGSGTGAEPLGVFGTPGISTVSLGVNGATVTNYDAFVDAVTALRAANAPPPSAWIMAPRTAGQLARLKATDNQPLVPPARVSAIPQLETTSIPVNQTQGTSTDCSTVLVGNFGDLMLGMRQDITIDLMREPYLTTYQVAFVASLRADIALVQPARFARITGLRA